MAINVQRKLERNKTLKKGKTNWNDHWQLVSEYVLTRKSDFTSTFQPGEFLNKDLYDSTGPKVNNTMASALIGALWPDGANSFRFQPPKDIPDNRETKRFYDEAHEELATAMDDPEAGLITALEEYMLDQGAFGTSGIAVFDGPQNGQETPLMFQAWDVKHMSIDENAVGFVNTVYREKQFKIRDLIPEYGLENVSEKSQQRWQENKHDEDVTVLMIIEPRGTLYARS
jgi:hypothetical protein